MARILTAIAALVLLCGCGAPGPEGPVGPAGDSGQGAESLTDPSVQPKVIWTNPADGDTGLADGFYLIQVRFNKIMDITTIPYSATLYPVDSLGTFIDYRERYSYSEWGDVVNFRLAHYGGVRFRVNRIFTVVLSPTIKDINGNSLGAAYSFSFLPVPFLRVLEFGWFDIDTTIPGRDGFDFTTNAPIDPASLAGNVSILPEAPGSFSVEYGHIRFTLSAPLPPATTYTVTLGTGVTDTDGNHLPETYQQTFTSGQ